jgi:crotonobetainyl-CoA:carnitine CoA-transferase CaiB-like acyl-CoA transferase
MSLIGTEGAPPSKVQAPVVDVSAGFIATIGTLSRLLERVESGTGGHLDVSLFSSAVALQQSAITTYLGSGELPVRAGSEAPYAAPNEAFETADGWIMIAAYNGNRWEALCTLLGVPQLATDERLALLNTRIENRAYMKDCLSPLFRANTNRHWLEALEAADIICGEVASYEQLVSNPQVAHMKLFTSTTTTRGLTYSSPAFPVNTRAQKSAMAAPACGEHTAEILHSLGYSEAEIAELESHGAVRSMHRPLQPATAA